ncbi:nitrate/trimethylamine N-oxide reductase NapE/TorE [Pasteurellaceae bacterium 15-036681]|nr:nitrate/trimethylamine N-oxide reductase NapE/TorE [Pasteurellaceae bacterium 15-036681]
MSDVLKTAVIAGVILPLAMAACVGAYGLVVWLLQMFVIGLPTA